MCRHIKSVWYTESRIQCESHTYCTSALDRCLVDVWGWWSLYWTIKTIYWKKKKERKTKTLAISLTSGQTLPRSLLNHVMQFMSLWLCPFHCWLKPGLPGGGHLGPALPGVRGAVTCPALASPPPAHPAWEGRASPRAHGWWRHLDICFLSLPWPGHPARLGTGHHNWCHKIHHRGHLIICLEFRGVLKPPEPHR